METLWFFLLWWMLATYVVLDGFDLGVGSLHFFVGRSDAERRVLLRSVGPVWDGNEVWLLAAGGTMVFAFPVLYATSFAGFYLPLVIVLWLLVGRALGIELRHQLDDPLWKQFWDFGFAASSLLLCVFFGAALGNVVRGVSFTGDGKFFSALWTDFRVGDHVGILDWYTVLVAVLATAALAHHGALWLLSRTEGDVETRAGRAAAALWPAVAVLSVAVTAASFAVQPRLAAAVSARPWGLIFAALAAAGLVGAWALRRAEQPRRAFLASAAYLYGMLANVAVGLYPWLLPGRDAESGLTAADAASANSSLTLALAWWLPGMAAVCAYTYLITYRSLPETLSVHDAAEH